MRKNYIEKPSSHYYMLRYYIYRILDLISDDRVERPPYLDEIDGNF